MKFRSLIGFTVLGILVFGVAVGCQRKPATVAPPSIPSVPVSHPVERNVTDYVEYTGRTDAKQSVGIRARVTGYLVKVNFTEGSEVKKGDLLFEIDPSIYQAQLDQAKAQVALNEATLKFSQATYERAKATFSKGAGSQQEVDQAKASVGESAARVEAAKSAVKLYELNLGFTKVYSPIDGHISRFYYTLGNLIIQDQTLLTTVVSTDPMYAYFDMDERTILRIRNLINQGKIKARAKGEDLPVLMGLEGEEDYPHRGTVDFANNAENPSTGTLAVRGMFANPLPKGGRRLMTPGMFVRIRLPVGAPHPALLVVDRAIGSDQGLKYLYVVGPDNKLQSRRVKTGALQADGLRVIEEGITASDRVVVGSLPQLRANMQIEPEPTTMPTPGAAAPTK